MNTVVLESVFGWEEGRKWISYDYGYDHTLMGTLILRS